MHDILESLIDGDEIEKLYLEFDEHITPEGKFAHQCDKLECDLQCKIYDEEHSVDINNQDGNDTANDSFVRDLLDSGDSWSTMWLKFGQSKYSYDDNFKSVSNYAMKNKILKNIN